MIDLIETAASAGGAGSVDVNPLQAHSSINAPVPTRPIVPQGTGSSTAVFPKEHSGELVAATIDQEDMCAMSPRMSSEEIETFGREMRAEMRRHAKVLQDSLLLIFNRIETVKKESEELESHNKSLQQYIGHLPSKTAASGSHEAIVLFPNRQPQQRPESGDSVVHLGAAARQQWRQEILARSSLATHLL